MLADDSKQGSSISLTLWDDMAVNFKHHDRVIAIKGAKVCFRRDIFFFFMWLKFFFPRLLISRVAMVLKETYDVDRYLRLKI